MLYRITYAYIMTVGYTNVWLYISVNVEYFQKKGPVNFRK